MSPGYDVQSASTSKGVLYITGAPRYNHTGRVVIYRLDEDKEVIVSQILNGEQVSPLLLMSDILTDWSKKKPFSWPTE